MKILVTGASRGAGRGLAEGLHARGHEVRALVRKESDEVRLREAWRGRAGLEPVLGDVEDLQSLKRAMKGCDAFVHAAAAVGEASRDDRLFYRVNVEGTGKVWRAAHMNRVLNGVFISSVAVYGRPDVPEVGEDAPRARPEVEYERTKAVGEDLAFKLGEVLGIHTVSLRPSVIYGPHDEQFIPRFLRALRSRSFVFVGNPDRPINVCADEHLVECALAGINTLAARGEAFNVVDGELPSWRQVVSLVAGEAKLPVPTRSVSPATALRLGTALDALRERGLPVGLSALTRFNARVAGTRCVYRIDKARRVLAFRPTHTFLTDGPGLVRAHLQREGR